MVRPMNLRIAERQRLIDGLTKPGSDFQRALCENTADGTISLVCDRAEIIGWARTERWRDHRTLEAFTSVEHRHRGVARFAAAGLKAAGAFAGAGTVAVFAPSMERLAFSISMAPLLFYNDNGEWVRI